MKLEDLLNALPSKEELVQAVSRQTQPSHNGSDMSAAFGIFGAGLLLGAGLALLFAPKPGADLRHDITEKMNGLGERFGREGHQNGEAATES